MPVSKSAKKALRVSKRREKINKIISTKLEKLIRLAKKSKDEKNIKSAISMADKASKKGVIHKNKAARIKSKLSKLLKQKSPRKVSKKKTSKKSS